MDLYLDGKTCLVVGGSTGIGFAAAKALAGEGCHVRIVARDAGKLSAAAAQLASRDGTAARLLSADVSTSSGVEAVVKEFGDSDIVINSVSGIPLGGILDIDERRWRASWELKVFSYINLTREFYRVMCARRSGVIINVIGVASERADPNYAAGASACYALDGLTRAVGGNSLDSGVRVLAVNPGEVDSPHLWKEVSKYTSDPDHPWSRLLRELPLGRPARAEEVGDLIAFLASDRAGYISGENVRIDGGYSQRRLH
jgi:NAD(P)-dependent dehydrogenase (short-subunit alcohol dehydrogenase family)